MSFDPSFVVGNYIEACLWAGFGLTVFVTQKSPGGRSLSLAFLLFGLSDVVETRTGGWYQPWWMLTWKIICILWIVIQAIFVIKRNSRLRPPPR